MQRYSPYEIDRSLNPLPKQHSRHQMLLGITKFLNFISLQNREE